MNVRPRCGKIYVMVAVLNAMHMPDARREMMPSEPEPPSLACAFTRFSFMRSVISSPFFISHRVTRPSEETETRISPFSLPWSTHVNCQTGSVCLPPDPWPDSRIGFASICSTFRTS